MRNNGLHPSVTLVLAILIVFYGFIGFLSMLLNGPLIITGNLYWLILKIDIAGVIVSGLTTIILLLNRLVERRG